MGKGTSILLILVVLTVVSVRSQQAGPAQQPVETHVVPLKKFSIVATDKRWEMVSGDPAKAGEPFVMRIHAEAGYIIMPHTHTTDENFVVVKGSWALGMGERFNRQALEPMEVGTFGLAPKNMAHFGLSKTYTINQIHGIGPFTTRRIVPAYVLTDKGVLLDESSMTPRRPVPTSPPGCFELKLALACGVVTARVLSSKPNALPASSPSIGSKNQTGTTFGRNATN